MLLKENKFFLILIVMFIVSPFIIQLSPPVEDKNTVHKYSSYNPYSEGYEGIYRVCGKLGIEASRFKFDTTFLRGIDDKVLIIADDRSLAGNRASAAELRDWIAKGNKAILAVKESPKMKYTSITVGKEYITGRIGKGTVIINSNPSLFTNKALKSGAPLFIKVLGNLGVHENKGEIVFDEYIHGYGRNENVWDILPRWIRLSVIEILILFLGIMVMYGRRFGKPAIIAEDESREVSEYYSAVAALYKNSRDYEGMLKEYFDVFCGRVVRKYGGNINDYNTVKLAWKQRGIAKYDLLEECMNLALSIENHKDMGEKSFMEYMDKIDVLKKEIGV